MTLEDHFIFKQQESRAQSLIYLTENRLSSNSPIIWEWRTFWPVTSAPQMLDLASFGIHHWQKFFCKDQMDIYVWERDRPYNLKIRRNKLQYKPILDEYDEMIAFSPKEKFSFPLKCEQARRLYPRLEERNVTYHTVNFLLKSAQDQGYDIECHHFIKKVAKKKLVPGLVLEICVFTHENQAWRSVCLEGTCFSQLQQTRTSLSLPTGLYGGYLGFLKSQNPQHHV